MTWTFHVRASSQQRLFSRVLQILEAQRVTLHTFQGEIRDDEIAVIFKAASEEDKAYRLGTLLYRLEGVRRVSSALVR